MLSCADNTHARTHARTNARPYFTRDNLCAVVVSFTVVNSTSTNTIYNYHQTLRICTSNVSCGSVSLAYPSTHILLYYAPDAPLVTSRSIYSFSHVVELSSS